MDRDDPSTSALPDRPRRGLLLTAAAVLLAVVVVVAVVLVLTRGSEPDDRAGGPVDPSTASAAPEDGPATDDPTADDAAPTDELPSSGPGAVEAPPVAFDASPVVVPGVTLRVKDVTAVDGTATLPGEVSGPGVSVELELTNASGTPVDLGTTVVGLAYGAERVPANVFSTGTSSFTGSVATGTSATGTYVFAVPADERSSLRVTVDTAVDVPVVVFEGPAS